MFSAWKRAVTGIVRKIYGSRNRCFWPWNGNNNREMEKSGCIRDKIVEPGKFLYYNRLSVNDDLLSNIPFPGNQPSQYCVIPFSF